jgi:uncharacterized repeat protein (TIGR03843 family)
MPAVREPARADRPPLPAPEREVRPLSLDPTILPKLALGELEILGALVGSTNNAMVVRIQPTGWRPETPVILAPEPPDGVGPPGDDAEEGDDEEDLDEIVVSPDDLLAVWKPIRGERPLADFPRGTLGRREVAAFHVSEAMGWDIVPPTVLREGPYGEGMLQAWVHGDPSVDVVAMVVESDPRLRRVAVFDAVVNNTDRKGGHLIPVSDGHVHGIDHGVTFSVVPKLRTVLWGWRGEPLAEDELAGLERVRRALRADLGDTLLDLLSRDELTATVERVDGLLAERRFPQPPVDWPAVPWPPF